MSAIVGEHELLEPEVADAEHHDVVELLTGLRIDRVTPAAAMAAKQLAVNQVRRPPVVGRLLRGLRHRQRERVEVGHRRHRTTLPRWSPMSFPGRRRLISV
ncbi:MAG: hypothetical protein WAQ33_05910 [Gaiellaceae bacterium]